MRSILIGPPGAGKGTQSHKLADKFAIPYISIGQLFHESVGTGTILGMAAKHYLNASDLVPSDLTNALAADQMSQPDCRRHGFIRDGYPRSLEQAEAVSRTLAVRDTSTNAALKFQVREDDLLTRLKRRARADDTDEVIHNRLRGYQERTAPLQAYHHNELITIAGVGSIDEVFTRALQGLRR